MKIRKHERHGYSDSPEYRAWCHMKERCNNPTCSIFARYGGRGIRVCKRWDTSFKNFIDDMGPRPSYQHSLDRIDNNGDYLPENCRWATKLEQSINRGMNKNNTSGYKGVSWAKNEKKWNAQITINYKRKSLGYYETAEQAYEAYLIVAGAR